MNKFILHLGAVNRNDVIAWAPIIEAQLSEACSLVDVVDASIVLGCNVAASPNYGGVFDWSSYAQERAGWLRGAEVGVVGFSMQIRAGEVTVHTDDDEEVIEIMEILAFMGYL